MMVDAGKSLFSSLGCAACHTPNLGNVEGIYSDLLLHKMGQDLVGGGSYGEPPIPPPGGSGGDEGPDPSEWRTPPLWGVADSAPYMHDGRAATLEQAILMHGGQGKRAAEKFAVLKPEEKERVLAFLKTLRALRLDDQVYLQPAGSTCEPATTWRCAARSARAAARRSASRR